MCCVFVLLCLAAAVWRGLSLSPQVVVIRMHRKKESGNFPGFWVPRQGPSRTRVIWRRRINARARGYVPGANDIPGSGGSEKRHVHGTKMHRRYTTKSRKKGPFGDDQNAREKRPAPFCASREPGTPGSMIPSRYQHAPLAGPVSGYWAEGHPEQSTSVRRAGRALFGGEHLYRLSNPKRHTARFTRRFQAGPNSPEPEAEPGRRQYTH
jgi:hypothetical protein